MDNLGSHKGEAVRLAIREAGARLLFLPAYSPDLNPIEQVFANSNTSCARPKNGASRPHGNVSEQSSHRSRRMSAQTTSPMPDMGQSSLIPL
jgi:transposase